MILGLLLAAFAYAAPVTAALVTAGPDPGLEAADVQQQYTTWARSKKVKGPAAELACSHFAEGLELCFTKVSNGVRSYYTLADGQPAEQLVELGKGQEDAAVAQLSERYVDGLAPRYFLVTGQPRAHAAMLFPSALERLLGGKCVVGVPAVGVLVAWVPGDLDFDKVMAVGVKRMYDTLPDPVSPLAYTWDGARWGVWAEVKELTPPLP